MQFSTITMLALAAVATAAPADIVEARTGGTGTGACSSTNKPNQICCTSLALNCVLALGNTCGSEAYCCNDSVLNGSGGLINLNLNLLNCVKVL
ncbi:hypothetical protein F5Y00DRAFT_224028 [Daldinia vernicosa]|uniref:uncharacterized protein n=1 Tax=Daldinia vernicosa TaxID=114800 RepID=UPI002008BEAD|nr:uncharacterized protein F5Y00DRAFT_224028 [Daldinia vernicosa]KAI0853937.1 hypothetical protein F5Y00DRAFT_224028 [Daldinia vernicosa]